jgi:hypothetical protein
MDFKFVSHGLWSEEQNILLQHMHKKELWILINKCGNKLKHENDAKGPGALGVDEGCSAPLPIVREKQT